MWKNWFIYIQCLIILYLWYGTLYRILDTKLFYILSDTGNQFTNYKWLCRNRPRITDCRNQPWSTLSIIPNNFKVSALQALNMKLQVILDEISERTLVRTVPYFSYIQELPANICVERLNFTSFFLYYWRHLRNDIAFKLYH